ncbi:prolyl oligopeptidase family serine peptidase [Streptomyces celluloflavus]|uniref:prolyl oligopeptidase family serine peptidase n=1 Tax=Streptomyces celluloflavus TaxID=58344 RepID=UPI00346055D2|nr:prolyl oligopeptidase family serine peptidase [Streptomyces celluloflavus]
MASNALPPDPYRWLEDTESERARAWLSQQQSRWNRHISADREAPAWQRLLAEVDLASAGRPVDPPIEAAGVTFRHELDSTGRAQLAARFADGRRRILLRTGDRDTVGRISRWCPAPAGDVVAAQLQRDGHENGGLHLLSTDPGTATTTLADASPHPSLVFSGDWLLYTAGSRASHTLNAHHLRDRAVRPIALPVSTPARISLHSGPGGHLLVRTRTAQDTHISWWLTHWSGERRPYWQSVDLGGLRPTALDLGSHFCYVATDQLHAIDLQLLASGGPARLTALPADPAAADTPTVIRALRVLGTGPAPPLAVLHQTGITRRLDIRPAADRCPAAPGFAWPARLRLGSVARHRDGRLGDGLWAVADDPHHGAWSGRVTAGSGLTAPPRTAHWGALTATGRDGTTIHVTLCEPTPHTAGTPTPTLMTVYGGFGISLEPSWDPLLATWIAAGGRVAWVHARGGGEFGPAWAAAGRGPGKSDTVDDLLSAADALVEQRLARPGQLACIAASNGGLVVAAALVRAPHLLSSVVCAAPLTDMARYHLDGLGALWQKEYGDPTDAQDLTALLSYSPYHHVTSGTGYPPTLFITGGNDARVPSWHAWKLCAALQKATPGTAPIFLDHQELSGHYGRAGDSARALSGHALSLLGSSTGLRPPRPEQPPSATEMPI